MSKYLHVGYDAGIKTFYWMVCCCLFDDILIYSRSCEDHEEHLKQVMRTLRAKIFYINLKKCTFMSPSVVFLGFVVSFKGFEIDPKKIKLLLIGQYQQISMRCEASMEWLHFIDNLFKISTLLWPQLPNA